ncbi:MAG TPA: hypothetical protein VNT30_01080 [Stellaceae bacterium]|nr:hypothetical protein [Stellaceae bacterium]
MTEPSRQMEELDHRITHIRRRIATAHALIGGDQPPLDGPGPQLDGLTDDIARICQIAESLPGRSTEDLEDLLGAMTDLAAALRRHAGPVPEIPSAGASTVGQSTVGQSTAGQSTKGV